MIVRTLLAGTTALCLATPALAAIDPPKASDNDARMRVVVYDPNNPVHLQAQQGVSLRLILGADEHVERVIASDETLISPDDDEDETQSHASIVSQIEGAGSALQSKPPQGRKGPACDANLCIDVAGNFVYLRPRRSLDAQPLFIQTSRTDAAGRKAMVAYAFEIAASTPDAPSPTPAAWSVTFSYPARDKADKLVVQRKATATKIAQWRAHQAERQAMMSPVTPGPAPTDNRQYGYKGSAAVMPEVKDGVWDDGRTTFLRFAGNRRIPNVYRIMPDGKPGLASWATQPDATGTTLRVTGTERVWVLRDGDEAGCVLNGGADPDGRTSATVASAQR